LLLHSHNDGHRDRASAEGASAGTRALAHNRRFLPIDDERIRSECISVARPAISRQLTEHTGKHGCHRYVHVPMGLSSAMVWARGTQGSFTPKGTGRWERTIWMTASRTGGPDNCRLPARRGGSLSVVYSRRHHRRRWSAIRPLGYPVAFL